MTRIKRIVHYPKDDPEMNGDYAAVSMWTGRIKIAEWGDAYHDRGYEKSEGFIEGIKITYPDIEVIEGNKADWEC